MGQIDLQPTLRGKLLELRPLTLQDFDALYAAGGDPLIWEQHPEPDRYTRPVFQRYFDGAMESKGALAVTERKSGRIIGSSRYHSLNEAESQIEIGYTFLERKFWGGEYNGELKSLMIDHAFKSFERIVFIAGENNLRSRKALEKIGAKFLQKVQRPSPDGTMGNYVVYGLTRPKSQKKQ
jgi:RimJ/RimL family protein N-acetyltransferase